MTPEKTENETPLNDSPITGSAFEKTDEPSTEDTPAGQNKKPQAPRRRRRPLLWLMVFVLMVCLGAGTWAWRDARNFLDTPPQDPGKSLIVDIEPGMTLAQVAAMLEKEEVITDAWRFQMLVRYKEKSRNIQAGRFLVSTGWLPETVLDMLVSGKAMLYRLTIREGLAWWDVAELVEAGGFCKAADFTSVIHDPEFLRHWGIPFDSAEGFLYPETYLLPRPRELNRDAAKAVANRLVEMFWRRADKLWPNGKGPPRRSSSASLLWRPLWKRKPAYPKSVPAWQAYTPTDWKRTCCCRQTPQSSTVWDAALKDRFCAVNWTTRTTATTPIRIQACRPAPYARSDLQRSRPPSARKSTTISISWPQGETGGTPSPKT